MFKSTHLAAAIVATALMAASSAAVAQQNFPNKPLKFVVPSAPGLTTDIAARILAPELAKAFGQPVVVENKPGAGQLVGLDFVATNAPADGYTFVISTSLGVLPTTEKGLHFDPLKDLPPFIGLADGASVLISPKAAPWNSIKEMADYAKANPGKLNYAEASATTQFRMEAILRHHGADVVRVPYKSGGEMLQGIAKNETQMGIVAEANATAAIDLYKVLGATGATRLPAYPNVPTFTELGMPFIRGSNWALNVRDGTPKPIFDRLYAAASQALQTPEVKAQFAKINYYVTNESPEMAAKTLADEAKLYADLAKQLGMN